MGELHGYDRYLLRCISQQERVEVCIYRGGDRSFEGAVGRRRAVEYGNIPTLHREVT